jgi:hypothetical protein
MEGSARATDIMVQIRARKGGVWQQPAVVSQAGAQGSGKIFDYLVEGFA